jgi:hypothetical protein
MNGLWQEKDELIKKTVQQSAEYKTVETTISESV